MDMEDVLLLTAGLLAEDERVAAQVRRQYKWFVVDEFQDVSPLQSALLDLWLGGRDELCVVGDPAQTIYSFAGANADYLRDFPAKFPGTTSIELVRNYRSTPEVVAAANALLAGSASRGVELRAQRPSGPTVTYTPRPDEVAEAEAVAAQIARLRDAGRPLCEVAVLFRINAQSEAFEEALVRARHRRTSSAAPPASSTGPRCARRSPCCAAPPAPARPTRGDGCVDAVRGTLAGMGWTAEAPTGRGQTRDRWESLAGAGRPGRREFAAADADGADLNAFVDDLDRRASEQHAPVADGVTLATFHAAKGLEWDAVFLCGLQDGTLPITYADTPAAIEEERRLLYVGMTRARVDLSLSWALARNPGGRGVAQAVPVPRPAAARRRSGVGREPPRSRKVAELPRVRPAAVDRRREEARPLRRLPGVVRRGALRAAPRVAPGPGRRGGGAGVRRLHRRDAAADRRAQAAHPEALLQISGIGQAKLEQYGEDVLARRRLRPVGPTVQKLFREIPTKSFAHYRWRHDSFLSASTDAHHGPGTIRRPTHRRRWPE